ncbi:MAG: hypothetical protein DMF97_06400 [Acidobacteria bacterium]|nr:MAG: hypothetical protein DMF97_06400 [Acidobacteriota bacterium]
MGGGGRRRALRARDGAAGHRPVNRDGQRCRERHAGPTGRRRESGDRDVGRHEPPIRDEVEQEGRVHSDWLAVRRLQGHRRKGQADVEHGGRACAHPAAASKEAIAKNAELKSTLEAGIAASNAGNDDEAIAKFVHATELKPDCADCFYNIAFLHSKKKDYDKAEAAYKKAIELRPDYSDAYNGLANIYNAQRKFEEAGAASLKAAELSGSKPGALAGGNADAMFNQGVILWNAGKIADAKKQFEGVIAANPNHAEAHFQLGMALVNEGNLPGAAGEFETYLKIAPTGPNAAQAKALVEQLKK